MWNPYGRSVVGHLQSCLDGGQVAHRLQAAASSASAAATQQLVERPWDRQAQGWAREPAVARFGAPLPTHCNACECTAGQSFAKKGLELEVHVLVPAKHVHLQPCGFTKVMVLLVHAFCHQVNRDNQCQTSFSRT